MWLGCDGDSNSGADATAPVTDARVNDAFWGCPLGGYRCSGGCSGTFLCQSPVPGKVSVCGQLVSVASNQYVRRSNANGLLCGDAPDTSSPCNAQLFAFDAVEYAANPATAVPLRAGRIQVDDCGRFRFESIDFPTMAPLVTLATRNDPAADTSPWLESAVVIPVAANQLIPDQRMYMVDRTTDDQWTASAGNPFAGETFNERGVYMPLFLSSEPNADEHKRTAGVTVGGAGPTFYFNDTDANNVTNVAPGQTQTGTNGASLVTGIGATPPTTTGAEPPGCAWPSRPADTIKGVTIIHEHIAEAANAPCE